MTREPDPAIVAYLRELARTATNEHARGAYAYAAEAIAAGDHERARLTAQDQAWLDERRSASRLPGRIGL